ncbi:DUF3307 domain-containing protein [Mesonia sp. K7]|uniref:DUF3307 domain-containing protein n=1 Tax=Mesonia sp. K7 TaxID=2218606 RepID=UPI000DAAC405|nr:DUF3307 domain-containing protein [Mesonia sp. K7]PZD77890.1 DUF3307 domain-containing protein [Mesonia sp. K7]
MEILIKLILAHLIGDFILQPYAWVKEKEKKKLKSPKLYLHVLIHLVVTALLLWDLSLWPIILIITGSHLVIDAIKISLKKKKNKRLLFFIDQLLHLAVIFWVSYAFADLNVETSFFDTNKTLLVITSVLFLTYPVATMMKVIFSKWNVKQITEANNQSLENAGKIIGMLERVLVFIFIIMNHWEAVGFLITAKSVFRFGDLKEAKQRKLTEYVLIGTLISFGVTILTAIACQQFLYIL